MSCATEVETSIASKRPPRRCCAVAEECTPKLCVACKLAGKKAADVYTCRERLGHLAPNWDAPGASEFFETCGAEEALVWKDADALERSSSGTKRKVRPSASGKTTHGGRRPGDRSSSGAAAAAAPSSSSRSDRDSPKRLKPSGPRPTGAMSDVTGHHGLASEAPRCDFGVEAPLVFGRAAKGRLVLTVLESFMISESPGVTSELSLI